MKLDPDLTLKDLHDICIEPDLEGCVNCQFGPVGAGCFKYRGKTPDEWEFEDDEFEDDELTELEQLTIINHGTLNINL